MKQINLVPLSVRQKAASRRALPGVVLAGLLGLVLPALAWFGLSIQRGALEGERDRVIIEEQGRQAAAAKDAASLAVDGDLKSRVEQINTLAGTDLDWAKAFTYVGSLVPKDITVTNYSLGIVQGKTTLKLTGIAPSNVSYATFAQFLKESTGKQVSSFKVDGYAYSPTNGRVTFTITIVVPPTTLSFS
jgi:Tfp pilus assembly protein PilN